MEVTKDRQFDGIIQDQAGEGGSSTESLTEGQNLRFYMFSLEYPERGQRANYNGSRTALSMTDHSPYNVLYLYPFHFRVYHGTRDLLERHKLE